jgi:hypothetical protein
MATSAIRGAILQFLGDGPPAFSFLIAIRRSPGRLGQLPSETGGYYKQKTKTSEHSPKGVLCPLADFCGVIHAVYRRGS